MVGVFGRRTEVLRSRLAAFRAPPAAHASLADELVLGRAGGVGTMAASTTAAAFRLWPGAGLRLRTGTCTGLKSGAIRGSER